MQQILKYLFFVLCFLNHQEILAQSSLQYGGEEEDIAFSITEFQNIFYILGTTRKDARSSSNYYLLELYNNGSVKRETSFGGVHRDIGKDVIVDESGIYVFGRTWDGGYSNNDMLLTKLNSENEIAWKKYYGGWHNDLGHKFIKTTDNNFILTGFNRSLDDFGDAYVVKADSEGNVIWENHFGGRYVDHGFDVIENSEKEVIVVGSQGGFYNPTSTDYLNSDADIYIVKLSPAGEILWEKNYGGDQHDWAKEIIKAPDGGYFVCGSTQSQGHGSFDLFLLKIDEEGNELWMRTYGGEDFDYGESVSLGADQNLYLLGSSASYSDDFKPDHFLVKVSPSGEELWSQTYGSVNSDYSSSMIALPDSGVAFTGWTRNGPVGKEDIVFYKISSDGTANTISSFKQINDSVRQIKIFPNPVKNEISVFIDAINPGDYQIQIFTLNGKEVFNETIRSLITAKYNPALSSGMYILSISDANTIIFSEKLIVQ